MKKPAIIIVSVRLLILTFLSGVFSCCNIAAKQKSVVTLSSPSHIYDVQLEEQLNVDTGGIFNANIIWLSLFKSGKPLIEKTSFYRRNDSRFWKDYPHYDWVAENNLRFWSNGVVSQSEPDEIFLDNQTSKDIVYFVLKASTHEMFLLLDLQPGETIVHAQPITEVGVRSRLLSGSGYFAESDKPPLYSEQNFRISSDQSKKAHYCIKITDDNIFITSRELNAEFEGNITAVKDVGCGIKK